MDQIWVNIGSGNALFSDELIMHYNHLDLLRFWLIDYAKVITD